MIEVVNPVRPEIIGQELRLRCKDMAGVIEYGTIVVNDDLLVIPVVFRRRCKNQQCCPRRAGFMAVHRWVLYGEIEDEHGNKRGVGEYVTEYVPDKDIREILV